MMTKKDYEKAARIAQDYRDPNGEPDARVVDAFVQLFQYDNHRFDEARFRRACVPGANVRARGRAAA